MPKNAINWETTEVSFYKFVCKDASILYSYVGHTTSFLKRKGQHKGDCNNSKKKPYNLPLYVYIREHGGVENWTMVQIHSQICKNSLEARQIEQELIEQQQFKLNLNRAFITEEERNIYRAEYREQHKEEILKYGAEYREQHKEELITYKAEYYQAPPLPPMSFKYTLQLLTTNPQLFQNFL